VISDDPTRPRESRIPLPAGFRHRHPSGPGLDFVPRGPDSTPVTGSVQVSSGPPDPVESRPANGQHDSFVRPASGSPPRPRPRAPANPRPAEPFEPVSSARQLLPSAPPTTPEPPASARPLSPVTPPNTPETRVSERPARVLPRLSLAPLEPAELLYERLHEPSDESPILYRERAYVVDALQTDDDLEEHLEAELSRIRRAWRYRDASQFVQLSLYDHRFYGGEPLFPPIATLSWKDWQGRTEIWVRGVRRSTLPPGVPLESIPPVPRPDRLAAAERHSIAAAREVSRAEVEAAEASALAQLADPEPIDDDVELLDSDSNPIPLVAGGADSTTPDTALEGLATVESRADPIVAVHAVVDVHALDDMLDDVVGATLDDGIEDALDDGIEDALDSATDDALDQAPPSSEQVSIRAGGGDLEDTPEALGGASDADAERPPDSGPGWQSPDRSGEYLIPLPDEPARAPTSQRVSSEELIGLLFERMHELALALTINAGADYVLGALAEHIPCDGALIHILEPESEAFVVMRALGPDSLEVLTRRTPAHGSHLGECLRRQRTLELRQSDIARSRSTWQALGVIPRHVVASPIHSKERAIGVIELARVTSKGPFNPDQVSALEYVCEQFAEFVADRPIDLARESLLPHPAS
jgi:hypothetical protein